MNNLTIVGRLTKDPVLRKVMVNGEETSTATIVIAVDDGNRKDKNGNKIGVEFFRLKAWRGAAETIVTYCKKGDWLTAKGAVHLEKYTGENGVVYYMSIPHPDGFEFCGKKVNNESRETDPELPWDEEE